MTNLMLLGRRAPSHLQLRSSYIDVQRSTKDRIVLLESGAPCCKELFRVPSQRFKQLTVVVRCFPAGDGWELVWTNTTGENLSSACFSNLESTWLEARMRMSRSLGRYLGRSAFPLWPKFVVPTVVDGSDLELTKAEDNEPLTSLFGICSTSPIVVPASATFANKLDNKDARFPSKPGSLLHDLATWGRSKKQNKCGGC